ncbi:MAG: hypothetical protein H7175_21925 [Burkholderiales bacterium]|nr:hypothetical protein [Anaerolineae bacterium]
MHKKLPLFTILAAILMAALMVAPVLAQAVPSVSVSNQLILGHAVRINSVYSAGPGFVVIHQDGGGQPGPVAGQHAVNAGWTYNLEVEIDSALATPTMFAMLHVDDGTVGVYEFDGASGLDNPVSVNGSVVTPSFTAELLHAHDQFLAGDTVTIATVVTQQAGWLVIHAGDANTFGPVLGQTQIQAGTSNNVVVSIQQDGRTPVLWPMTHVDTGAVGQYEFGIVEGADAPVVILGEIATLPIWTVPHIRAYGQASLPGDGQVASNVFEVESVLAQVPGFLVVHNEQNGTFGPVAGFAPVPAGLTEELSIPIDPAVATPRLWPMLHVDDTTVGQYEFGTVQGADAPVLVNGEILTLAVNAAPSLVVHDQSPLTGEAGGTVRFRIDEAVIDAPGWIAIHTDANGQPGPVIGTVLLAPGRTTDILVEVDGAGAGARVFPMLHYDTGVIGTYEFGTVDNTDNPVFVGGNVVVVPLGLTGETAAPAVPTTAPVVAPAATEAVVAPPAATEAIAAPPAASAACSVSNAANDVNLRSGPGTNFPVQAVLGVGQSIPVTGQTTGSDGQWWQVSSGGFVRADVVQTTGDCSAIPTVDTSGLVPPAAPAAPPPPAATQEVAA